MKKRRKKKWKRLVDTKYFDPNADLKKAPVRKQKRVRKPRKPREARIGSVNWVAIDGNGLKKAIKMHQWLTRYIAWAEQLEKKR